jgi:aspartyl-tRNA(Asn)/glutamyl-tRNA(Gln) amidotransferase subunit C
MKIDKETVDKIAHLARLEFQSEAKKEEMIKDMNNMLGFIDKLNELDTTGVDPLIYMSEETNVLREDDVKHIITQDEALKNAPKKDSDYFKVPKVMGKSY